ncbi:MAG TPA: DciA family protein, partial [Mycobacterium sp.]|nr:DciA family protein [Mycobacterium sp.]
MSDDEVRPPAHLAGLKGMDLVRRTLEEARGAARSQGKDVGRGRGSAPRRVAGASRRRWSGPGPDARDPQPLGAATRDLARSRGWSGRVAEGAVFGRWPGVVGEQIAAHA